MLFHKLRWIALTSLSILVPIYGIVAARPVEPPRPPQPRFIRGDTGADGQVSLTDPVEVLGWLFLGGIEPGCLDAADADDSGSVEIADAIGVLNWLFLGGPPPAAPGPFDCGPDPTSDRLSCNTFPACALFEYRQRIDRNGDGSTNGVSVRDLSESLFEAGPSGIESAFKTWIIRNSGLLGFSVKPDLETLEALELVKGEIQTTSIRPFVFEFAQTYRGVPVVGPAAKISVSLVSDSGEVRALSVTGTFLDDRVPYDGLTRNRLSTKEAHDLVLAAWFGLELEDGPSRHRLQTVGELDLVAVPSVESLAWRGEILDDGEVLARLYIHAVQGNLLGYDLAKHHETFDHRTARVLAYLMADNPDTEAMALYPTPGSTYGGCTPLPPHGFGCFVRMGNERAAVYDFEQDNNSAPRVYAVPEYQPGIEALVPFAIIAENDPSTYQFTTQNIHHKLHAALAVMDPIKSPFGWDHHPDAPFSLFEPPPLTVMTNIDSSGNNDPCSNALGAFFMQNFNGWDVVEHPYPTNDFPSAAITLCQHNESTLFHEIGHYYDQHSGYGILGDGLVSSNCTWDTSDEAPVLRETVADMVRLCLYRKLYPGLPFDLSTTESPCMFTSLGASVRVHGASCGTEAAEFDDERPSASGTNPCQISAGYRLWSVHQALWKFLNARACCEDDASSCLFVILSPAGSAADAAFESMLYALSLSNLQSYKQFFENMSLYIGFRYGEGYESLFRSSFELHGLLNPE